MSNSTSPAAATAANLPPCPGWCDPKFCEVTPGDVVHRSTPVCVETVSATYRVHLLRYDEPAHPREWGGPPVLRFEAESREEAFPGTRGRTPVLLGADIALDEVLPLLGALAGQFALAGGVS